MENLETLKDEFKNLKDELFENGFKTVEELKEFESNNSEKYNRYYFLQKEIEQLEWNLLSPKEQAEKLEQRRLSKLKREGKLF